MSLPSLTIKGHRLPSCIVQGGMGAGVSIWNLAGAVASCGGLGVVSSAGIKDIISRRGGVEIDTYRAVRITIERTRERANGGVVGINVMCALVGSYEDTIRAAIDARVDVIISGAGLPLTLPSIKPLGDTALVPIVSSAQALSIIIKRWGRIGYRPDAVVLEGPLAGGHLGFKPWEITQTEFQLENLLPPVLEEAGDIPVIVAGGIYTHEDIVRFLAMGASGVQMGTRFVATHECDAPQAYKDAVVAARKEDILVVSDPDFPPSSPCRLPFRLLTTSPAYRQARSARCRLGYVLQRGPDGKLSRCLAMPGKSEPGRFGCICAWLLSAAGDAPDELPCWTVGANAYRVDKIVSVVELMVELRGP